MQHFHSSSPHLAGVSAQRPPPCSQLIRTNSAPAHGLCFWCAEGPVRFSPKGQLPPFPCWKGAGQAVARPWPAVQVARGQHGAPQQTLAGFWHHLLCKTVLFCSTDVYNQVMGQYLSQSGLAVMLCSLSVQLLQLHLSIVSNILQTLFANRQDRGGGSCGGGCPRRPAWCDGDPGTGLQLSLVPSGGAPGHLTAFLPRAKPHSLPRASLGWVIPPSKWVHGVQSRLFPTRVLLVTKGELQSYIASFINASESISYTY